MDPIPYNQLLSLVRPSNVVMRTLLVTCMRRNFSSRAAQVPVVVQTVEATKRDSDVIFTHGYEARLKDESSEDMLMVIRVEYELALYTEETLPDEFLDEYKNRQLPLMTRPYFRELVANCAPRALIQAPPLPTQFIAPITEPVAKPTTVDAPAPIRARRKVSLPAPPPKVK